MQIDYKKFESYSADTQEEITAFCRKVIGFIELYGQQGKNEITIYDYERGNFNLQKIGGTWPKLSEIVDHSITEVSSLGVSGYGSPNDRRMTVDITIKYRSDTLSILHAFLKKSTNNRLSNDAGKQPEISHFHFDRASGKLSSVFKDGVVGQTYQLEQGKTKYRLIKEMVEDNAPITTKVLAYRLSVTERTVMQQIGEIRKEVEDRFDGISGKEFIPDSVRNVGYSFGSNIKIKIK